MKNIPKRFYLYLVIIIIYVAYQLYTNQTAPTKPVANVATNVDVPAKKSTTTKNIDLSCEHVLSAFNQEKLGNKINNIEQLSTTVRSLRITGQLPPYYVTKKQASNAGWTPGTYFNSIDALHNAMIGGDYFGNFEKKLPQSKWTEADLDYVGKKRNAKRLVFDANNQYITVDHYDSFHKVPACQ